MIKWLILPFIVWLVLLIFIFIDAVALRCFRVAFLCYKCKGNGQDKLDPLFDCKECNGTGLLICETYSPNYPEAAWIKSLWFQWKPKSFKEKYE